MARLLIFNCSNDMALASGASEYVPTKPVAMMEEKYASFLLFIADEGDVTISPQGLMEHNGFQKLQESLAESITEICPWGWSIPLRNRLLRYGAPEEMMPDESRLEELRKLSSREFGVKYANILYADSSMCAITSSVVANNMMLARSQEELMLQKGQYIAKKLWSSSGRGNKIFLYGIDHDIPTLKYPIQIDRYYNKVLDFAMEFNVGSDKVDFLGLSVFMADKDGRYELNHVESQYALTNRIRVAVGKSAEETAALLSEIRQLHLTTLNKLVVGKYSGPLGIDMMVVDDDGILKIHPVVELNFRMNMGICALKAYQKYGDRQPTLSLSDF